MTSAVSMPTTLDGALHVLADHPDAHVLAGGTDLMVEVNYGHRRPPAVLSLRRVDELRGWRIDGDEIVLGAGLTYAEMETGELADLLPALAQAARTVGSPQIRNTGTVGGNLGTASPAGDTLPVLSALDATVVLVSVRGERTLSIHDFITGPKRTAREPDELIVATRVPRLRGPQEYLKVGTRNAMVISVAGCAVVVDLDGRTVRCALGSVGPVPIRCHDAEAFMVGEIDWDADPPRVTDPRTYETFGSLAADASRPIDDHRSTAAYRRHACGVMARRALMRCL